MIELRNVTKYYPVKNGARYVLRNVSVTIPDRTNLAILGPNGAGKSTLLRLIGGAEPADSGTIITDSNISWPLGLTSGFQGSLTGRENVLFVCRINGLNRDESRYVISQVTEFAELHEYFDMPVIRAIVKDAEKNNYRFSAILMGIIKSPQFQMRTKTADTATN